MPEGVAPLSAPQRVDRYRARLVREGDAESIELARHTPTPTAFHTEMVAEGEPALRRDAPAAVDTGAWLPDGGPEHERWLPPAAFAAARAERLLNDHELQFSALRPARHHAPDEADVVTADRVRVERLMRGRRVNLEDDAAEDDAAAPPRRRLDDVELLPPPEAAPDDQIVQTKEELFSLLSNPSATVSLRLENHILLSGTALNISHGQRVRLWSDSGAAIDADGQSRVIMVRAP